LNRQKTVVMKKNIAMTSNLAEKGKRTIHSIASAEREKTKPANRFLISWPMVASLKFQSGK